MNHEEFLFPYETIRPEQGKLMNDVKEALSSGKNLLAHAPTGLGKTIAALGPALKYAIEHEKVIFFLTSRHTQHHLAIKTLTDIKKKFGLIIKSCDLIGKKWMCAQPGAQNLPGGEFSEYCRSLREDHLCEYYEKTYHKGKPSLFSKRVLVNISEKMPASTEVVTTLSKKGGVCPYEIAAQIGKEAHVIIGDYNHLFNEGVRMSLLKRIDKQLGDIILIVDEGHNLPTRCRDELTTKLSTFILQKALTEAKKFKNKEVEEILNTISQLLVSLSEHFEEGQEEDFVLRSEFVKPLGNYEETIDTLLNFAKIVREEQRNSFVGSVADFMKDWTGPDHGFCRTINRKTIKQGPVHTLTLSCLDPSLLSKDIVNETASTILMSGTLTPGEMYADLLGFRNYSLQEYNNPYAKENRLNLVVDEVTTKYSERDSQQYKKMATILSEISYSVPGNTIVFFPSYSLRDQVDRYLRVLTQKKIILELPGTTKEQKEKLLTSFRASKDTGSVLLAVTGGSFGEGVDLPGDLLKCVVVVGIPLSKPTLETKELIDYYDDKFGEGISYGYIYPAITKTLQNAGRCIRSETDRGVIVFMDARYTWENYAKCFPGGWDMKITKMWQKRITNFFQT